METFLHVEGYVLHLEIDLADNDKLLFSEFFTLEITDGVNYSTLVGSGRGYAEGIGTYAEFNGVSSFCQLNITAIVVVDQLNTCLRLVDRSSLSTLHLLELV